MRKFNFIILILFALVYLPIHAQTVNADDYTSEQLMAMDLDELMNLTITIASKKSENSFDSPLSSTVITSDEIQKSGATSIAEIFRLVPGFIVREETNGVYDLQIRGNDNIPSGELLFASENTFSLVMIDNRKVYNYIYGGVNWESFPISINDIERIEIIRGAATAMYGPNAVSGVINIITKKAEDKAITVNANAQAGSSNTQLYDFALGTSQLNNRLNLRVTGNFETRDRFENDYYCYATQSKVPNTQIVNAITGTLDPYFSREDLDVDFAKEQKGINLFTNYSLNDNSDISLDAGYQYSKSQNISMETLATPLSIRETESTYINYQGNFNNLTTQAALHTGTYDIIVDGPTSSKFDFTILEGNIEYNLKLNHLSLRPGINAQNAEYSDLNYITETKRGYVNGDHTIFDLGYFVKADYQISDKLRTIAALRMDHYNKPDDNYFTYQFLATYSVNDKNLLRANISRANRGPFIADLYSNYSQSFSSGATINFLGNENIDLPVSDLFELGYRSKLRKNLNIDLEIFHSITKDFTGHLSDNLSELSYSLYTTGSYTSTFNSTGAKAKQTGISGILNLMPSSKYSVKAFGTYQYTTVQEEGSSESKEHKNTPNFYGGINITANPLDKLTLDANLYYTSKQTYEHLLGSTEVESNTIVNAKVDYKVASQASVFVNGRNLLNTNKEQFGFGDVSKTMILGGVQLSF